MDFTVFTLIETIFWVSVFAKIISLLRRQMLFLKYFSIYPLLIVLLFCIFRLFLPIEWPFTTIINSRKILPFVQSLLCTSFLQVGFIKVNLMLILSIIWGIGTIFIIFRHVIGYFRFKHLLNFLPETENRHLYDILQQINKRKFGANAKIIVHDSIESPAIFGITKPVILLPNMQFSDDELLAIFIHESTHQRYGHCIIKYIAEFIRSCFWWNPLFKEMALEVSHVLEMHSDKAVCRKLNAKQQKEYLFCIARVSSNIRSSFSPITCNLVEENNEEKLKQRFKMILDGSYQSTKKCNLLIIPILIIMFLLSYSAVLQPYSLPDKADIGPNDQINSECYLVETENGYNLYDSTDQFIAPIKYLDENLNGLKIYKNLEDVK